MRPNKSKALRAAEKYILQGKLSAAIDEYRMVVENDPTDYTTVNTLGDLYVRAGKIEDAIYNFSLIGERYRENGFSLKAIAMFKKILKLDPSSTETATKLASLYLQQGFLVEARQLHCQIAEQYLQQGKEGKALDTYQRMAALDPSNASVRMKMGEIYCRQGLTEQAHDSFIVAAAEFARGGEAEQALNAYIKALSVYPDSRQALLSVAKIHTEQGRADRAINILCAALEKTPEDVELLSLLGSAYLAAGSMDEAERTFFTVVALDRNRYEHLFRVGQVFLEMGELDRAAEQLDECLDILIAKRQEDKAIGFLRRVLDCDPCHVGSLERLARVFSRTGDDPNLIDTLKALAEAGTRKGNEQASIAAFKELTRLEPDERMYNQRLYDLGVRENVKIELTDDPPDTTPLDHQREALEDASVMMQISKAEISAKQGEIEDAVSTLREIIDHYPDKHQARVKLKEIYEQAGMIDLAAGECIQLACLHEARGELARASDYIAEARQLYPVIESASLVAENQPTCRLPGEVGDTLECVPGLGELTEDKPVYDEDPFHLPEAAGAKLDEPKLNEIDLTDPLNSWHDDRYDSPITAGYQTCSTSDPPVDDRTSLEAEASNDEDVFNLIKTLETLAEAALRKGKGREAIEALKALVHLEPGEPTDHQGLYDLGVRDFMSFDLLNPLRPAVSFDYRGGALDDASVMKEVFKAEIAARRGEIERAVAILRQITDRDPQNILARAKLKDVYTRAGLIDLAANESLQLARLYEARRAPQPDQLIESPQQIIGSAERPDVSPAPSWQRKVERVQLSLPLLVAPGDGTWREYTESLNVSQLGLMFRLMHLVEPGTPLRIKLPMPMRMRLHQNDERLYTVDAVVCHATESAGETLVGVEFRPSVEPQDG